MYGIDRPARAVDRHGCAVRDLGVAFELRADSETREIAIGGELLTDLFTELQAVLERTQQNLRRTHRTTAEEDLRRSHALVFVVVSGVFITHFVAARDGFEV